MCSYSYTIISVVAQELWRCPGSAPWPAGSAPCSTVSGAACCRGSCWLSHRWHLCPTDLLFCSLHSSGKYEIIKAGIKSRDKDQEMKQQVLDVVGLGLQEREKVVQPCSSFLILKNLMPSAGMK